MFVNEPRTNDPGQKKNSDSLNNLLSTPHHSRAGVVGGRREGRCAVYELAPPEGREKAPTWL